MRRNNLTLVLIFLGSLLPASAIAANGIATGNVNMRTGPSTKYQVITTIPNRGRVEIYGCLSAYRWCDVSWAGWRGWVSSRYLAARGYYGRPAHVWGPVIGVRVIRFSFGRYHDRHYRKKRWYKKRRKIIIY